MNVEKPRARVSVVIVACNEERTIGRVLSAANGLSREVILVDSGSTDSTMEIAYALGARIYKQEWLGYAKQKNYAMSLASGDWILSLDADEIIPEPLIEEIRSEIVKPENEHLVGYKIPRLLFIGTTPIKHSGFYPDAQLRLIRKGSGEFNDRLVHERIVVDGPTKTLSHPILHYSYSDLDNFSQTLDKYARLHAQERLRHGKPGTFESSFLNECLHPLWTFLLRYIIRQGYLDGEMGLKVCQIYSDYVRKKIKYLREAIKSQQ